MTRSADTLFTKGAKEAWEMIMTHFEILRQWARAWSDLFWCEYCWRRETVRAGGALTAQVGVDECGDCSEFVDG